jgi:enamine deaminase RidA (YjgF/YER057c/UK114 family)
MMIERYATTPRMSQAVAGGGFVFLSGQVAANPTPSVKEQTDQILQRIDHLLAAAGSNREHILSASVWLADISQFAEFNSVWDAWVAKDHSPARATVEARLAAPEYLVEIAVIALRATG